MRIPQLSLTIANQPGHLIAPCKLLADAGINILTLTLADTQRFGILRLILKEPDEARAILERGGFIVKTTDVVAVMIADQPGGLRAVLDVIEQAEVNIEYMYAFTARTGGKAVMVFRLDDADKGIAALRENGINVLSSANLYELAGHGTPV